MRPCSRAPDRDASSLLCAHGNAAGVRSRHRPSRGGAH